MEHKKLKLNVPDGFRNLLESLTCEILRVQPTNIPSFAADYLKGRLTARQESGYDECLLGSQIDGFYKYEPFKDDSPNNDETDNPSNQTTKKTSNETSHKPTEVPRNVETDTPSNHQPERRVIHYEDKDSAASKIQAGFHGYKCRQQIKEKHQAAEKIQAGYRGYACRQDLKQQHEAATKIQTKFKEYQVKGGHIRSDKRSNVDEDGKQKKQGGKESNKSKQTPHFESKDDAAVAIQSGYRGYRDRKELSRQSEAATKIQAGYRGYRQRKLRRSQSEAAIKIQSSYRGYHVRQIRHGQSEAALKIQKTYRGYRARKVQRDQSQAATKIQSNYRGYRTRKDLNDPAPPPQIPKSNDLLQAVHYDTRSSFSIPNEDVNFDGVDLDSDSDIDIDKVVDQMEAKKKMTESGEEKTVAEQQQQQQK